MLITLSGDIGAGKDTLANLLQDQFESAGITVEQVKFADPLREVAFALNFNPDNRDTKEFTHVQAWGAGALSDAIFRVADDVEPLARRTLASSLWIKIMKDHSLLTEMGYRVPNISCRTFMQLLGTEFRNRNENYFLDRLVRRVVSTSTVFICSDCRYPNEQAVGGYKIYIHRPGNPHAVKTLHSSEAYQTVLMENADVIVKNDGTANDLSIKSLDIVKRLI